MKKNNSLRHDECYKNMGKHRKNEHVVAAAYIHETNMVKLQNN